MKSRSSNRGVIPFQQQTSLIYKHSMFEPEIKLQILSDKILQAAITNGL